MYYIISLTHTLKREKYITLWRPDNAGYCWSKENAGLYETIDKGYHDSEGNMPILAEEADKLFQKMFYGRELKDMIPNTKETWKTLNVKMGRDGLERIKPKK